MRTSFSSSWSFAAASRRAKAHSRGLSASRSCDAATETIASTEGSGKALPPGGAGAGAERGASCADRGAGLAGFAGRCDGMSPLPLPLGVAATAGGEGTSLRPLTAGFSPNAAMSSSATPGMGCACCPADGDDKCASPSALSLGGPRGTIARHSTSNMVANPTPKAKRRQSAVVAAVEAAATSSAWACLFSSALACSASVRKASNSRHKRSTLVRSLLHFSSIRLALASTSVALEASPLVATSDEATSALSSSRRVMNLACSSTKASNSAFHAASNCSCIFSSCSWLAIFCISSENSPLRKSRLRACSLLASSTLSRALSSLRLALSKATSASECSCRS
mmetsp:Transcript_71820/g.181209  ORF Transcript_71820/g.181209 Transcript_71820/m.181209 type:complete len:339 (+) Transcript_71820:262-1278(+)